MKQKPLHLKPIDEKERLFFHYKLDATTYILYDSDMGEPVAYGSFYLVGATISKLPKSATIFYFELDTVSGWKMKRSYKPKEAAVTQEDKKTKIEEKQ